MYQVIIKPRAEREFVKLPEKLQKSLYEEFEKLAAGPFDHSNVKKISGTKFGYRLRIGRWRVLFALFLKEEKIEIVDIFIKKGKKDYHRRKGLLY